MRFKTYKSKETTSRNKDVEDRQPTADAIAVLFMPPKSRNSTYCGSYSYLSAILEQILQYSDWQELFKTIRL